MTFIRARLVLGAFAALGFLHSAPAAAQDAFPSKPIRIVTCCIGFPEAAARLIGAEIERMTKQPVVVEAKPGANGILAADHVARAEPDGYTVFLGSNSTHAANQSLFKKLPYDYVKDFVPVTGICQGMLLAVVNGASPVSSVSQLTALAKNEPGKLTYGWGSSSTRAAMELYNQLAGVSITNVPYKGNPQATMDVLGGRVTLAMADLATLAPMVSAGKLRALAVTGPRRAPAMPDVPTFAEAGVKGYEMTWWNATWVPAGTPAPIVKRLNELITAALDAPKVKEYLVKGGTVPFPTTSDELMKFQLSEHGKWQQILSAAKIQPQ